jgi:hypothetical protein
LSSPPSHAGADTAALYPTQVDHRQCCLQPKARRSTITDRSAPAPGPAAPHPRPHGPPARCASGRRCGWWPWRRACRPRGRPPATKPSALYRSRCGQRLCLCRANWRRPLPREQLRRPTQSVGGHSRHPPNAPPPPLRPPRPPPPHPPPPRGSQLEAYNARDLETFMTVFDDKVVVGRLDLPGPGPCTSSCVCAGPGAHRTVRACALLGLRALGCGAPLWGREGALRAALSPGVRCTFRHSLPCARPVHAPQRRTAAASVKRRRRCSRLRRSGAGRTPTPSPIMACPRPRPSPGA